MKQLHESFRKKRTWMLFIVNSIGNSEVQLDSTDGKDDWSWLEPPPRKRKSFRNLGAKATPVRNRKKFPGRIPS
jgi:hypothetical protein